MTIRSRDLSAEKGYPPRKGAHLHLIRYENVEGDGNRGWIVDAIEARVDGERAGYIKLAWIPGDRFTRHYSRGMADWLCWIKGWSELSRDGDLIEAARYRLGMRSREHHTDRQVATALRRRFGADFESFKDYNLNRPQVDYVAVYREATFERSEKVWPLQDTVPRTSTTNFQGAGLGGVLYEQAALWLAEKGLVLHASGCQTDLARAAWERIAARQPAALGQHGKRLTLDGKGLTPLFPSWVGEVTQEQASAFTAQGDVEAGPWVFHNTKREKLSAILAGGLTEGSFAERPLSLGGDAWIAVRLGHLPGPVKTREFVAMDFYDPAWSSGPDGHGEPRRIPVEQIFAATARGGVAGHLAEIFSLDAGNGHGLDIERDLDTDKTPGLPR